MPLSKRVFILVPLTVFAVAGVFLALGYLGASAFQIPPRLTLPLPIRLTGLLILLLGFIFFGWLFKYRKPADILVSTYVTFSKVGKGRLEERSFRTEPLVVKGPYKYVRHPLYSGVVFLFLGWWLLLDYTFLLISAIIFLLWFNFVVAPFEEKELRAIFGDDYERYATVVPRIIPFASAARRRFEQPKKRLHELGCVS